MQKYERTFPGTYRLFKTNGAAFSKLIKTTAAVLKEQLKTPLK